MNYLRTVGHVPHGPGALLLDLLRRGSRTAIIVVRDVTTALLR